MFRMPLLLSALLLTTPLLATAEVSGPRRRELRGGRGHHHGPDDPGAETRWECHDGKDNDGDGKNDCADPDCLGHPCCTGQCADKNFRAHFCDNPNCKSTVKPCAFKTLPAAMQELKKNGCEMMNAKDDCSERCAQAYLPIYRECSDLLTGIPADQTLAFRQTCIRDIHGRSHDRYHPHAEFGRACHDGKDNDGDNEADCKDPDCSDHPCCGGIGGRWHHEHEHGTAEDCKQVSFRNNHPWCTDPHCDATRKVIKAKCDTATILPVVLTCTEWTQIALSDDGKVSPDDNFCDSTCFERLAPIDEACHGRMAKSMELALSALTSRWTGHCNAIKKNPQHPHHARTCESPTILRLQTACPEPSKVSCDKRCLRTIDSLRLVCKDNGLYESLYSGLPDSCAESSAQRQCKNTHSQAQFLTYINTICCRDKDCTSVPKSCTPECADVFLPYFSRCGRYIFGKDQKQLGMLEHLSRQCAKVVGRDVPTSEQAPGAQLHGPDQNDVCSTIKECGKCSGVCGWCKDELKAPPQGGKKPAGGGWCSSECLTTDGECASVSTGGH